MVIMREREGEEKKRSIAKGLLYPGIHVVCLYTIYLFNTIPLTPFYVCLS